VKTIRPKTLVKTKVPGVRGIFAKEEAGGTTPERFRVNRTEAVTGSD
jgi:hypothetical protein